MPVPVLAIAAGTSLVSSVASQIGSGRRRRLENRKSQIQENLRGAKGRLESLTRRFENQEVLRGVTGTGIKFSVLPPRRVEVETAAKQVKTKQKDLQRIEKEIQKPRAANILRAVGQVGSLVSSVVATAGASAAGEAAKGSGILSGLLRGKNKAEELAKGSGVVNSLIQAVTNPGKSDIAKGAGVLKNVLTTVKKGGGVASAISTGLGSAQEAGFLPGRAGQVAGIATNVISNFIPTRGMAPGAEPSRLTGIGIPEINTSQIPDIIQRKGREVVDRAADRVRKVLPGSPTPTPRSGQPGQNVLVPALVVLAALSLFR